MIIHISLRHALLLGMTTAWMVGQVPINDSLVVTFPSEVHVGGQLLPPGEYTIRQLNTSSSPRLLEFSTNKGTAIQASATAFAVVDSNNQNDSSVVLETRGGAQYVHRIWIKGKSYGYEFPVTNADNAELASSSKTLRLNATYASAATPPKAPEVGPAVTSAAVTTDPAPATPIPAAPPQDSASREVAKAVEQGDRPKADRPSSELSGERASAAKPQQPDQAGPRDQAVNSESSQQQAAPPASSPTPPMPETSLNWMGLVLTGMGLIGSGLLLHASRRRA